MIDLHTHILPGVDDGLNTEDEAVEFARVAYEDGVRTIVATPHCKEGSWDNTRDDMLAGVERLRDRLERERQLPLDEALHLVNCHSRRRARTLVREFDELVPRQVGEVIT